MKQSPRICDYEASTYRRDFWETADRAFEDAAERLALRSLLPPTGRRLLEIGAGYGRLADEYSGYGQVILLDYARSMLNDARQHLGNRYTYVCADLYHLPLASCTLDTVVQVRVLHHVEDVPAAVAAIAPALGVGGSYILEFANKHHLKAILRHLAHRQTDDPFTEEPHEFVTLNWNFHPGYVERALGAAGLTIRERRAVSHFRLAPLKQHIPARALARLDHAIGGPAARLALAPSQFVRATKLSGSRPGDGLWRCPTCGHEPLTESAAGVPCTACGRLWPVVDGVYVFREG